MSTVALSAPLPARAPAAGLPGGYKRLASGQATQAGAGQEAGGGGLGCAPEDPSATGIGQLFCSRGFFKGYLELICI